MQYKEMLKKIIAILVGGPLIVRPFLSAGGLFVVPVRALVTEISLGVNLTALFLFVAVLFDLTHISLGALLVSLGFEEVKKLRKPLLVATLILLGVSVGCAAYLFGH